MTASWLGPIYCSRQLRLILIYCLLIFENPLGTSAASAAGDVEDDSVVKLSADKDTSETLLRVLNESPQVASFRTDYKDNSSDCGEDQPCSWEVKLNEADSDEFIASLRQNNVPASLVQGDGLAVASMLERDPMHDYDDQDANDEGAYAILSQAWAKLVDDFQETVGQIKRTTSPMSCYFTATIILIAIQWGIAGVLKYTKHEDFVIPLARRDTRETLAGSGVYGSTLSDLGVNDEADSHHPSWTTPPLHRGSGVQRDRHHAKAYDRSTALHGTKQGGNLLSRTDVEYYDVEGMLDDVPYYEPRLQVRDS